MRNYLKFLSSTLLPSVPQPPPGLEQITRRSWRGETESERAGHVSDASLDWCARVCVCVCVYLCTKFDIRICHKGIILDCMTAFNHRIIKQFISFSPGATLQPPSTTHFYPREQKEEDTCVCFGMCVFAWLSFYTALISELLRLFWRWQFAAFTACRRWLEKVIFRIPRGTVSDLEFNLFSFLRRCWASFSYAVTSSGE